MTRKHTQTDSDKIHTVDSTCGGAEKQHIAERCQKLSHDLSLHKVRTQNERPQDVPAENQQTMEGRHQSAPNVSLRQRRTGR